MISPKDYNKLTSYQRKKLREEYVEHQEGRCHHCGGLLSEKPPQHILSKKLNLKLFPPNFLKYPVHLHHCHETGMTIGAVHSYCNGVLWQYHGE